MSMIRLPLLALVPAIAFASPSDIESFEKGVPDAWKAAGGALKIVTEAPMVGKNALRWTFNAGDSILISTGPLGPVNVSTGYGGYSRSAFEARLNFDRTGPGKLVIEFLAGDAVAGFADVPLAQAGWQKIAYHYSWNSGVTWVKGGLRGKLDAIRIRAVGTPPGASVDFDAWYYNVPRDFRDAVNPVTKPWAAKTPDFSGDPAPTPEQLANFAKLDRATSTVSPNGKYNAAAWEKRLAGIRAMVAEKGYHKGHAFEGSVSNVFIALGSISGACRSCPDPAMRDKLAAEFVAMDSWLHSVGLVTGGAMGKHNNYVGRYYVDAVAPMRDYLAAAGTLETVLDYVKWAYDYDGVLFAGEGGPVSMDYFHNEAARILQIALMHRDPVTRWHHVARFRKVLSNQLVATIKPDGSLFHHGFHYFAYGTMGMGDVSALANMLTKTGFPITEPALDAIRLGLMTMRRYAAMGNVVLSFCGRHPSGTQGVPAGAFLDLAEAYRPYRGGKPDADMMAAYLRLRPGETGKPAFAGFSPEAPPQGFYAMPYAGFSSYRKDGWLAGVKGFGKTIAAGESYANANRFGLYLSNGFLELQTTPEASPTVHGSGCRPDEGWDWCAPDGTTTIHAPLAVIANGNGTRSEYGSEAFVGGLAMPGGSGVFAQTISSGMQAALTRTKGAKGGPFRAHKSYHFFGDRIVCLGSGIGVDAVPYPVRTTLFQKFLTKDHATVAVGGETLAAPASGAVVREAKAATLLTDPYGNAYLARSGVRLSVGEQVSRDGYDGKDTRGLYAKAWIDHGENPDGATYEYVVAVRATTADIAALSSGDAGYRAARHDAAVHAVVAPSGALSVAVFDAKGDTSVSGTPFAGSSQPCLAGLDKTSDGLRLTLTDPAPAPDRQVPATVTVRLAGRFDAVAGAPPGVSVSPDGDGFTRVAVPVMHGEGVTVRLTVGK